ELRAAMSLLATQGVGIFDKYHYVVHAPNSVAPIPLRDGTHVLTWKALIHWADLQRSSELLQQIITPGGLELSEWRSGIFTAGSLTVSGGNWLRIWGMDIARCARDQHIRNVASYRPSRLQNRPFLSTS